MTDTRPDHTRAVGAAGPAVGWMVCAVWLVCRACDAAIEVGQWQGLVEVPGHGRCWVHEACVATLGYPPRPREAYPDREPGGRPAPVSAGLRVAVIGDPSWPRSRAVEVRDALDAVTRGHHPVVLIHTGRDAVTGRAQPLGAWVELTAQRLGHQLEHLRSGTADPDAADIAVAADVADVAAADPDVVVAFPLHDGAVAETVGATAAALEALGIPVLTHHAHPPT